MRSVLVEIVAQTPDDAHVVQRAGADRIELCAALEVGGITPSPGLFASVRAAVELPIAVMIRPRSGDFTYSPAEVDAMATDVRAFAAQGVDALVFGCLRESGEIDVDACARLVAAAGETPCVFHRGFDQAPDPQKALDVLIELGFARVLTAGGRSTALESAETLRRLVEHAAGGIEILVGGGVRAGNVAEVVARTGTSQVHLGPLVRRTATPTFGNTYDSGWRICEHSVKQVLLALT